MAQQFFEELSRCLRKEQIESYNKEDRRLEIFLHGQPVLSVSPGNEVFLLPAGSKNPEANELYHRVAIAADSAFEYVEAMENTPLLRARGLENKFHLLADFGGAVLAGRERAAGQGYEFVTWIWDYEKVGVSHGHYYEDDFAGAKRDFAVRSGLISNASLFSKEELTELYRATEHLLADDPDLNDKQMKAIQEARIKIEFSVPDLDTQLEHRQDYTLDEGDIHDAVISAMNELFQTQVARNAVKASISAVLAGEEQTLSLPAVELQIRNLQERQLELFQLIVSAGADCTDYDEELRQVNMAKTKLMAKKAELEKEQRGAAAFEERLAELDAELEQSCGALTDFDELTVRQLVSNIKVLDKDSLLICFKDGTEITQAMQRRQTA